MSLATINPLTAELIFRFSSYSAYLIARFAFFSVSVITVTAKFFGKVPSGAVSICECEILRESH